ncbi:MAG TPA: Gfo/Idh/MocA family oxidoreductase [Tepidisphaeraceae bacterium]|jgi:predicted dehydrogenase|nr:Gfo/Idh/MocA family oxidoreductase [Tepidisphaeraceae bacterium]
MNDVRIGIIGFGNMGQAHAGYMATVKGAKIGAIGDVDDAKRKSAAEKYGVPTFAHHRELLASGTCDAVIVATPHYDHVPVARDAFEHKLHVMIEKPVAVSVTAAREINEAAARHPNLRFGIMYNQRTNPLYRKMRDLIAEGELGEVTRVTWIVTNWFRTWTYYGSGGWRATWAGEGGGVLINQCPHNLDLLQWITGLMPNRVTAVGFVGKTHPIEVEDEMSAILEYPNGAIGHFVTSTGEAPGTNRLEICGDRGKMISEDGKLTFFRTRASVSETNKTSSNGFTSPETWKFDIPIHHNSEMEHKIVTQRFVDVIRQGRPNSDLFAEGTEGVRGLEIGNAMMMSGLNRQPITLPMDGAAYDAFLIENATKYGGRKTLTARPAAGAAVDMNASFGR